MSERPGHKHREGECRRCWQVSQDVNRLNPFNDDLCYRCRMALCDLIGFWKNNRFGRIFNGIREQRKWDRCSIWVILYNRVRYAYLWKFRQDLFGKPGVVPVLSGSAIKAFYEWVSGSCKTFPDKNVREVMKGI